ncbi:MAG: OmpH family outer membrane protein [Leeuwenhoekiella sp.]
MKKIVALVFLALVIVSCDKQKTGFVNTEKIVKDYTEMTEAQSKYTKLNQDMMGDLESKAQSYQMKIDEYQKSGSSMSSSEREKKEQELIGERQQLQQEQQMRSRQLQQESQSAIDTIIKKVKDHVSDYGKKNGYDYIYGQNDAGSILYGKEENDLTDEVLKELNDAYKPVTDTTATK